MSKSMRPGGVQNARLFGEKMEPYNSTTGTGIPGLGDVDGIRTYDELHLIKTGGNWSGPVVRGIEYLRDEMAQTQIGLVRYTAELQSETEIMYTLFFSVNRGSDASGDRGRIPEAWRVNVPYKISNVNTSWGANLFAIDDEKWRLKWALNKQGWAYTDKRTQNLIKSATGSIMKIEENGDIVVIENSAVSA